MPANRRRKKTAHRAHLPCIFLCRHKIAKSSFRFQSNSFLSDWKIFLFFRNRKPLFPDCKSFQSLWKGTEGRRNCSAGDSLFRFPFLQENLCRTEKAPPPKRRSFSQQAKKIIFLQSACRWISAGKFSNCSGRSVAFFHGFSGISGGGIRRDSRYFCV